MRKRLWTQRTYGNDNVLDLELSPGEMRQIFDGLEGVRGAGPVRQKLAEELCEIQRDMRLVQERQRARRAAECDLAKEIVVGLTLGFEGYGWRRKTVCDKWGNYVSVPC